VRKLASVLFAGAAFLAMTAPTQAGGTLAAVTQAASGVTASAGTLKGQVTPISPSTAYYFDYGTTAAYGNQTPAVYVANPPQTQVVQATIAGLQPGTEYHYRVVAGEGSTVAFGADATFKTAGSAGDPTSTPTGGDTGPLGSLPAPGGNDPAHLTPTDTSTAQNPGAALGVTPVLGHSVGAGPAAGNVRVRVPGSSGFVPLDANVSLPTGSTLDTRAGTVNLVTAVGASGATQGAQFRGSLFQVRQSAAGGGLTDIYLRGGDFSACRSVTHKRLTAARTRGVRRLWGRDRGGRFRTHGAHAVATVRGTEWVVADRCDGTLTKVAEGSVSVRDRVLHKKVLVTAGHSYLARAR
jgi:hypothetical protein